MMLEYDWSLKYHFGEKSMVYDWSLQYHFGGNIYQWYMIEVSNNYHFGGNIYQWYMIAVSNITLGKIYKVNGSLSFSVGL